MSAPAPNDADLVHASLAGHRGAFGQIVARYQSLVCSLAYSATGSLDRSEDLAQETFVAAWRQLPGLREPSKLRAWLCGIARHLISNAQRRAGREPAHLAEPFDPVHEAAALEPSPPDQAVSKEEAAILWRALEKIPETYREPLVLFYREHKSVEAVARELDLSEDAVRQRLARGRALLHEQVLALVEGTLARTNPGRAFTSAVLAALPAAGAATATTAAGVAAAKHSTAVKAAAASGVGVYAGVLGFLGTLGGYVGWQMSDTRGQTPAERVGVVRFWRVVAIGFALFLVPAFVLPIWRHSHPWVLAVASWWLGLLYAAIAIGFALYAWQQHRRIRGPQAVTEPPPPMSRRRLLTWVGLGTFAMALLLAFCALDYGGWRTKRVGDAEVPALLAAHPTAKVCILKYQNGERSVLIEDNRSARFAFPLTENTSAALKQSGVRVETFVQGRDFELLGWAGRFLFVPALLIVAAGVVILIRALRREKGSATARLSVTTN